MICVHLLVRSFNYADYKFYKDAVNQTTNVGVIWKSKKWIPFDDENIDYQEYLEWAKTNTAEAADEDTLTWDSIRATRDQILSDTDWTMTTGASVDQAQWAAYRQNIRDIPQTYSGKTPDEVVWPTQPSTAGPNT